MGVSTLRPRLTEQDVHRLVRGETAEERASVAHKLCRRIALDHLTPEEKAHADEIVEVLLQDAAELVRRTLAVTLRNSPRLSRSAAMKLAADVEAVAVPILRNSPVLTDEDLIEIVLAASAAKQEAVAERGSLSTRVTETIAHSGLVEAVRALAANPGAQWTDTAYDVSLERFKDDSDLQKALIFRETLPLHITEKLVSQVSGAVFERLVNHHELPAQLAIELASGARERATVDLVEQAGRSSDLGRFVQQLNLNGRLTPSLIMRSLCMGHVSFVEHGIAELAGLPHARVWLMIHDAGALGLQAVFDRSGLPRKLLPAFRAAIDIYHDTEREGDTGDRTQFQSRMVERVLTQFQAIPREDLDYLLEKLDRAASERDANAA
jgi:uncharacterized protein (DUF2336 family)